MNIFKFEAMQKAVSHINRLGDTRDRVRASMEEAQQMFNSLKAINANNEKLTWALKQQKFWSSIGLLIWLVVSSCCLSLGLS